MKSMYQEYCTGCGMCQSVFNTKLSKSEKGFLFPDDGLVEKQKDFFREVCPAGGCYTDRIVSRSVWGDEKRTFLGWSKDAEIRKKASSGGVLTALCCALLENHAVDGIIQTKASHTTPYATKTVISRTAAEVKECMGSRYSISSPLSQLLQKLVPGEKYAFVGKPCDVSALRSYCLRNEALADQIEFMFSFFCAGIPSDDAQKKLLSALEMEQIDCRELQYRGNGWPGFATAVSFDGTVRQMSYNDSWGKILGRDVPKICRYCLDGIGLASDIVCGDAWYLDKDGNPDFSEHSGRNVVIIRTEKGMELYNSGLLGDAVELEDYDLASGELEKIQRYQYEGKIAMISMINALKITGKTHPFYNKKLMRVYAKHAPVKMKLKRFSGTVYRVIKGKI